MPSVFSSKSCSDRSDVLEPARGVKDPPAMESSESRWIVATAASGIGRAENRDEMVPGPRDGEEDSWEDMLGKNGDDVDDVEDSPGENKSGWPDANGEIAPRGRVLARFAEDFRWGDVVGGGKNDSSETGTCLMVGASGAMGGLVGAPVLEDEASSALTGASDDNSTSCSFPGVRRSIRLGLYPSLRFGVRGI